ncbi:DUF423 domain-containing protein [Marinobacter caseinilyticus]|uniref:DUF423 domain-containing protein n=1 Tax=Marinobacter caseinilyticus TaxID=2692195 RepID=UPI003CFEF344
MLRWPLVVGAVLVLFAVMAGAFGAHGLKNLIDAQGLAVFQTGVTYQVYHGLGLMLVAILGGLDLSRQLLGWAAAFFTLGTVLFSGSLYLLVLTTQPWLGPVTPAGGLCFMVGWVMVIVAGLRPRA